MKREDYIHASMRVRVLEKQLIPHSLIRRMAEAEDFEETMRVFAESHYSAALAKAPRPDDYEFALKEERDRLYKDINEIAPGSPVNEFLALPYRYHDVKVLIREQFLGEDLSHLLVPVGGFDSAYFKGIIQFPEKNPKQTALEKAVAEATETFAKNKDPRELDVLLDKACIARLKEVADELDLPMLADYMKDRVDFLNLTTFFRARPYRLDREQLEALLFPGGRLGTDELSKAVTMEDQDLLKLVQERCPSPRVNEAVKAYLQDKDLTAFEKRRDDAGLHTMIVGGKVTYGPEVLLAYAMRKEAEIQNLRIILISAKNNIGSERVQGRLRVTHE